MRNDGVSADGRYEVLRRGGPRIQTRGRFQGRARSRSGRRREVLRRGLPDTGPNSGRQRIVRQRRITLRSRPAPRRLTRRLGRLPPLRGKFSPIFSLRPPRRLPPSRNAGRPGPGVMSGGRPSATRKKMAMFSAPMDSPLEMNVSDSDGSGRPWTAEMATARLPGRGA